MIMYCTAFETIHRSLELFSKICSCWYFCPWSVAWRHNSVKHTSQNTKSYWPCYELTWA